MTESVLDPTVSTQVEETESAADNIIKYVSLILLIKSRLILIGGKVIYFGIYLIFAIRTYTGKLNKSIFTKEVTLCIAFFIDVRLIIEKSIPDAY
jgi:hypothetical protein